MKPDIFALSRCTSAESIFSCCSSAAALALANCNWHVAEACFVTAPAHTSVLFAVSKLERLEW